MSASQVLSEESSAQRFALGWRDLNVADDIRITAFLVAGIHGRGGVAVRRTIYHCGIRVEGRCGQHGVDLRIGAA